MVQKVAFEVISEFVFNETGAILATNALTDKVVNLSKKTDEAIFGVGRLAKAYATQFISGGGGVLGILGSSIASSEKFRSTQIELANTMVANGFKIGGAFVDFNQAMGVSEKVMGRINAQATKFGLSSGGLANATKTFSTVLAPKGLAGDNLGVATDLARFSLKGVPALGIDQNNAQSQIFSAIGGTLSKNTLFGSRIFAEAGDAIAEVSKGVITDVKSFNNASGKLRVKALIAGLKKLSGEANVVTARTELISNRLSILKDQFLGTNSIFVGFGDTLRNILSPLLLRVTNIVNNQLRFGVDVLNKIAKRFTGTVDETIVSLSQFANLHRDIEKAAKATKVFAVAGAALSAVSLVNSTSSGSAALSGAGAAAGSAGRGIFGIIGAAIRKIPFASVAKFMLRIGAIFLKASIVFAFFLNLFQILTGAAAKLKIQFFKLSEEIAGPILKIFDRFQNAVAILFEPLNRINQFWIDFFGNSTLLAGAMRALVPILDFLVDKFEFMAVVIRSLFLLLETFIGGVTSAIFNLLNTSLTDLISGNGNIFGKAIDDADEIFQDGVKNIVESLKRGENGESAIANNNITANIKNTFNIKEKIEPDRIAFTMRDQLGKVAENRRSAVGAPRFGSGLTPNI